MQPPRAVDDGSWTDRQNIGRAIREMNRRAGRRHLHHVFGELAGRMRHVLIRRGDVARGRVIVGAEMRSKDRPRPSAMSRGSAIVRRLRRSTASFHHQLDATLRLKIVPMLYRFAS